MDPSSRSTTGTESSRDRAIDARNYREQDRLLDGRTVLIRAIRPEDKQALREGFHRLSERSIYLRFFQAKRDLSDRELQYLTELDFENHVGLLAVVGEGGSERGIGVGRYIKESRRETGKDAAEVAFTVDEAHHGLGVGTLLLRHLARIARAQGIEELEAYVLAENRPMLEVLEHAGMPMKRRLEGNVLVVTLSLVEAGRG